MGLDNIKHTTLKQQVFRMKKFWIVAEIKIPEVLRRASMVLTRN
jgi:hypothetical protein